MTKAFSQVEIGEELTPISVLITQELINRYAELSGDYNPLHVDEEFGRRSAFKSTIAHGPIALAYAVQMLARWLEEKWPTNAKTRATFIAPVFPGDLVAAKGKVVGKEEREGIGWLLCELFCENQKGEKVLVGQAELPVPQSSS